VFVDEIEDCVVALIKVSPGDLFVEYGDRFDESMMHEIYDTVQERIRHECLSHEHEVSKTKKIGQSAPADP
jgi:hypothetical protein